MRTPWPRKRAEIHLEWLGQEHGVQVAWLKAGAHWTTASATPGRWPVVHVPKPNTPRQYLVALHEFGHVLSDLARELDTAAHSEERYIACEGAAWAKAIELADLEILRLIRWPDWMATAELMATYWVGAARDRLA